MHPYATAAWDQSTPSVSSRPISSSYRAYGSGCPVRPPPPPPDDSFGPVSRRNFRSIEVIPAVPRSYRSLDYQSPYQTPSWHPQPHHQHQQHSWQPPPPPPPAYVGAFYCSTCAKNFPSAEVLEEHYTMKHVYCTVPGCDFHARPEVLVAHRIRVHAKASEAASASLAEDGEELKLWLEARKAKFPLKKPQATEGTKIPMSKLERAIRVGIRQASAIKKKLRAQLQTPCVYWENSGRCRNGAACQFAHLKQGLCEFFSNTGKCKHGAECKYAHGKEELALAGTGAASIGELTRKLLISEIGGYMNKVLQAVRFIVDQKFFQDEDTLVSEPDEEEVEEEQEEDMLSDDSEE